MKLFNLNVPFRLPFCLFVLLFACHSLLASDLAQMLTDQQLVSSGRELFVANCAGCHGINADGKGESATMLDPKPRNLVAGAFKFRTTPLASLPTTEDLIRTIDQGVPHSSMPSFRFLAQQQKLALASYIKSLRDDWAEWEGEAVHIPPAPKKLFAAGSKANLIESAYRGEKLFMQACHTCHGDMGKGNGPNSAGLTDSDGNPLRPANLGLPTIKSGPSAQDVYKAIFTGLDGTPMPAFAEVYSQEQIWDLVSYVFYLRGRHLGVYTPEDVLMAKVERQQEPEEETDSSDAGDEEWN